MYRRDFLKKAGAGGLALGTAATLGACSGSETPGPKDSAPVSPQETIDWKLVTTWPKNFPGLGTGVENLARLIGELSGGRMRLKIYGAGELVPTFEVFDAVARGTAEMGHGAAYYWKGKVPAAQFFATMPFGMTAQETNAWIYHGGGQALWDEVYQPFGVKGMPAGNTGVQMGGWFNKEINSLDDLKGLKMRIPGLGGEVLQRLGGTPVNLPGGEIFTSLQSGNIDATEWVGPYNDLAFGLYKAAKYYYYPGFHEPGTCLEALVNKQALAALPTDLQAIVLSAAKLINMDMLAEYSVRNPEALQQLIDEHGVELRQFPAEVLAGLRRVSGEVIAEVAARDPLSTKVYQAYMAFLEKVRPYTGITELAYVTARDA